MKLLKARGDPDARTHIEDKVSAIEVAASLTTLDKVVRVTGEGDINILI